MESVKAFFVGAYNYSVGFIDTYPKTSFVVGVLLGALVF